MKRNLTMSAMILLAMSMLAVPAKRIKKTITLADGTKVETVQRGDEYLHYLQAADGRCFKFDDNGVVKQINLEVLREKTQSRRIINTNRRNARSVQRKATWGAEKNPVSGTKKGLVILVNYSDKSMKHTQSEFNDIFNKVGYKENGFFGSVHDYFYACSYGKFDLEFDVVGPYTLSKPMSYYGQNDDDGNDLYPASMVGEAVKLADADVNYKDYDWDGDGEVDQVYVVYAGYGEASYAEGTTTGTNTIWPHEWSLSAGVMYGDGSGAQNLDGVKIDTYACSAELYGTSGTKVDGIGTACHEFSHCMCIPDMYDTTGNGNFGMDSWDLMDYGCYNGDGYCPAAYTSYERMYCGWLEPIELTTPTTIEKMPALTQEPVAYLVRNGGYKNEYYLLENRQLDSWDSEGYGHGMLVLHVDFSASVWEQNEVNNTASRQRMTPIPADNSYINSNYGYATEAELAGDPFPGTKKKTELTDTSTPKASLYNTNTNGSKLMGHPITKITESSDGKIGFAFDGGKVIPVPVVAEAVEAMPDGFTATWQAVEGAEYYQLSITEKTIGTIDPGESKLIVEDFAKFNNGTGNDGTTDISSSLDKYTKVKGWGGVKLFTSGNGGVKIGTSNASGSITTPTITPSESVITILINTRKYTGSTGKSDTGNLEVYYGTEKVATITPETEDSYTLLKINPAANASLKFQTTAKRAFISYIGVYDGDFGLDDIIPETANIPLKAAVTRQVDVYGTSYQVTGIDLEKVYSYRVRAIVDGQASDWSNSVSVDIPNAIQEIKAQTDSNSSLFFDLNGRRVALPVKGIYIQNGKKIHIK